MIDPIGILKRTTPCVLFLALAVLFGSPSGAMEAETNTGELRAVPDGPTFVEMAPEGMPTGMRVLYAPSSYDTPALRSAIAGLLGGTVDYFDASASTPTASELSSYDCVFTMADYAFSDQVAMGDNLAAAVDAGKTTVVLGSFSVPTAGNFLAGAIMTAAYCPVMTPTGTALFSTSSWAGDGVAAFTEGAAAFEAYFRDDLAIQGSGAVFSTYLDGEIAVATRFPDWRVTYLNGATGDTSSDGDWPLLIANACRAGSFDVLVFDGGSDNSYAVGAVGTVAANYSVVDDALFNAFLVDADRDWDLVLVDSPSTPPAGGWDDLIAYANAGGPVVMSFWDWGNDNGAGNPGLGDAFGFQTTSSIELTVADNYAAAANPGGVYANAGIPGLPHNAWVGGWSDDGDIFGLAPGAEALGVLVGQGPVVIRNAPGNAIASFVLDSWDGAEAEDLWRNLAHRVLGRSDFDGAAVAIDWLYPDAATILESHELVVGPTTDLPTEDMQGSVSHSINLHGPYFQVIFNQHSSWQSVDFNGWRISDLNGELPTIVGARIVNLGPGITGVPAGSVQFDDDWVRSNFAGMSATTDDQVRIEVHFGLWGDGFETGGTSRWSATVGGP